VILSPYDDIEDEIFRKFKEENDFHNLPDVAPENAKSKAYWKKLMEKLDSHSLTREDVFAILEHGYEANVAVFQQALESFINGGKE
jgi:hypothetical protein